MQPLGEFGISTLLGKLINFHLTIVQYMCLYVKTWLERCKLSDQITTYSMALMVVYFLQQKQLLPSIELLQQDESQSTKQYVGRE